MVKKRFSHYGLSAAGNVVGLAVLAIAGGFLAGWLLRGRAEGSAVSPLPGLKSLRLQGYQYISPLLACDTTSNANSPALDKLRNQLQATVDNEVKGGSIDKASVFVRYLNSGNSTAVNPDEKYYPASLNKIPVMITAYEEAQATPSILNDQVSVPDGKDYNQGVEIWPKEALQPGKQYSVEEAMEKMILYSDNNAFYALAAHLDPQTFQAAYKDLHIPERQDPASPLDYMTAEDFSYFLRVLYNSTYLSRDYSEQALQLLGGADFKEGIVAGVPTGTQVAHKFGIDTAYQNGKVQRELHDCGIVYQPNNPYLLCVMTKSSGSLTAAEKAIQKISTVSYGTH